MSSEHSRDADSSNEVVVDIDLGLPGNLCGAFRTAREHAQQVSSDSSHGAMDRWVQCDLHLVEQVPWLFCDPFLIGSLSLGMSLLTDFELTAFTNSGEIPPRLSKTYDFLRFSAPTDAVGGLMSSVRDYLNESSAKPRFDQELLEQVRVSMALIEATYRRESWMLRKLLQEPFTIEREVIPAAALHACVVLAEVIVLSSPHSSMTVEGLLRSMNYPESIISLPDAIRDGLAG